MSNDPTTTPARAADTVPARVGLVWSLDEARKLHRWEDAWRRAATIARRDGRDTDADKMTSRHFAARKRGLAYHAATKPDVVRCTRGDPCHWGEGTDGRDCRYLQGCVYQANKGSSVSGPAAGPE